ncbi:isochorismatase family protein [Neisseria animalis]|uniref:Isochorismatase family protein n=1 Tax=Neisseria animalis TaxID=492 RepID=A0A5P3MP03_NEIAN|nr:isochorismatase family protein [Neisseria animalis]QEY23140.1 isochorismatase family protein [Neisseria animalis]ROW32471.1 isochorismatase family protein [Neisseria animalis]VEE08225.1 nicotinamidase/pyrazinamidase [Neisseria animalis]
MKAALIVVDVQNEYFQSAGGAFPQWQADETAEKIAGRIRQAEAGGWLVVGVRHFMPDGAPMFQRGTNGVENHASVAALLADKPEIQKAHADSFLNTDLASLLAKHSITDLFVCGIMTQNCVTHTAISPQASAYTVNVFADCCTAPSELVHVIALDALKDRVAVI